MRQEAATRDDGGDQQLLRKVGARLPREPHRAERAQDKVHENPDVHSQPGRQPEERQEEHRPRERRFGIAEQRDAATLVGVPRRELVEVDEGDASGFPSRGELESIAGGDDFSHPVKSVQPRRLKQKGEAGAEDERDDQVSAAAVVGGRFRSHERTLDRRTEWPVLRIQCGRLAALRQPLD